MDFLHANRLVFSVRPVQAALDNGVTKKVFTLRKNKSDLGCKNARAWPWAQRQ